MEPVCHEVANTTPAVVRTDSVMMNLRPQVVGKFLHAGGQKISLRGVTYGPFRSREDWSGYADPATVERDMALMSEWGINAIRTYTVPPEWLLDLAGRHRLWVLVGMAWEQHMAFLEERWLRDSIRKRTLRGVQNCDSHPAILGYTLGNEIPSAIVRWYGRRRIEKFLRCLYDDVKDVDPGALVSYVNYPTTEYLQLPFLDFLCFNVFLEHQADHEAYVARLQNLAEDLPLVLTELGLDSRRNGLKAQADSLAWQVRSAFQAACAGVFVFSWTDEWYRGGPVEDWDFGLTDRQRRPKPALARLCEAWCDTPVCPMPDPPLGISVVVCAHNEASTIGECLEGVTRLDYPDFEVIVVDDGSTDGTGILASGYPVKVIRTENRGLSSARNLGLKASTGEIIAYLDADAYPDRDWLTYLVQAFQSSSHVGIGGPNIAPREDSCIADCIAHAPGSPTHVLLTDDQAEHIPGCNMAFRKESLEAIGGFDERFRIAGDDVDVCWRLQDRGWTLGFHPGAVVMHHRRRSIGGYWRQQFNYGRAESMLAVKWPARYSRYGHPVWTGRLYGNGRMLPLWRWRVYHGTWGQSPFQSIYAPRPKGLESLMLMPEWYLVLSLLACLSVLGVWWKPLLLAFPALLAGLVLTVARVWHRSMSIKYPPEFRGWSLLARRAGTASLALLQPLGRLSGRFLQDLQDQRRRRRSLLFPRPRRVFHWSEEWRDATAWLTSLEGLIRNEGVLPTRGGGYDSWDLQAWGGMLGGVRVWMVVENHGHARQLIRVRMRPTVGLTALAIFLLAVLLAAGAVVGGAWLVGGIFLAGAVALAHLFVRQSGRSAQSVLKSVEAWREEPPGGRESVVWDARKAAQELETVSA